MYVYTLSLSHSHAPQEDGALKLKIPGDGSHLTAPYRDDLRPRVDLLLGACVRVLLHRYYLTIRHIIITSSDTSHHHHII